MPSRRNSALTFVEVQGVCSWFLLHMEDVDTLI
jgi:hypothetical protein